MPSWVREEEAILKPWVCWWWTSACSSSVIFWLARYLSDEGSFLSVRFLSATDLAHIAGFIASRGRRKALFSLAGKAEWIFSPRNRRYSSYPPSKSPSWRCLSYLKQ